MAHLLGGLQLLPCTRVLLRSPGGWFYNIDRQSKVLWNRIPPKEHWKFHPVYFSQLSIELSSITDGETLKRFGGCPPTGLQKPSSWSGAWLLLRTGFNHRHYHCHYHHHHCRHYHHKSFGNQFIYINHVFSGSEVLYNRVIKPAYIRWDT